MAGHEVNDNGDDILDLLREDQKKRYRRATSVSKVRPRKIVLPMDRLDRRRRGMEDYRSGPVTTITPEGEIVVRGGAGGRKGSQEWQEFLTLPIEEQKELLANNSPRDLADMLKVHAATVRRRRRELLGVQTKRARAEAPASVGVQEETGFQVVLDQTMAAEEATVLLHAMAGMMEGLEGKTIRITAKISLVNG